MVGIRRLFTIGDSYGGHPPFNENWGNSEYPPHIYSVYPLRIKNLTIRWVSTTYLKLGDMVDTYSKFDNKVGIYHIVKNWRYGGYPPFN